MKQDKKDILWRSGEGPKASLNLKEYLINIIRSLMPILIKKRQ